MTTCKWPEGTCACYQKQATEPDPFGRVWMHCESGLRFNKASVSRFVMFCMENDIEIGSIHPFDRHYPSSVVMASVLIKPDLIAPLEAAARCKLRPPPRIKLNSSNPRKVVGYSKTQDRSFPEAGDGRPLPPMGDDLMTAGLNVEDARFVAIQLAQNGLTLVPEVHYHTALDALLKIVLAARNTSTRTSDLGREAYAALDTIQGETK